MHALHFPEWGCRWTNSSSRLGLCKPEWTQGMLPCPSCRSGPRHRAHAGRAGAALADVPGSPAPLPRSRSFQKGRSRGGAGPVAQSELLRPRGPAGAGRAVMPLFIFTQAVHPPRQPQRGPRCRSPPQLRRRRRL